jgi:modulator of FtsH protease HflK
MSFESRGLPKYRRPPEIPWDRVLIAVPAVILCVLILYLLTASTYMVQAHEQAVVLRLGRYHVTEGPGLHFCVPLVDQVYKVSTADSSVRLPWGTTGADRPTGVGEEETLMLTGDLNTASVEWTIQWRVAEPKEYLFRLYREDRPEYGRDVVMAVARSVMNRLVGDYSIDEVLTDKRAEIGQQAREATQKILDLYQCGLVIRDLQMQRVAPPDKVHPSFDQVNTSMQLREQLLNEAAMIRNERIPKAKAEGDKLVREATGYSDRRRAEAKGEIESLLARYHAYLRAPEETRQRLYLETMQEVLSAVPDKVIIDADLENRILPLLPLEQGRGPKGGTP